MPGEDVDPILKQLSPERLALLRCVSCNDREPLEEVAREAGTRAASRIDGGLAPTSLRCTVCARRYPITADGIPIVCKKCDRAFIWFVEDELDGSCSDCRSVDASADRDGK